MAYHFYLFEGTISDCCFHLRKPEGQLSVFQTSQIHQKYFLSSKILILTLKLIAAQGTAHQVHIET